MSKQQIKIIVGALAGDEGKGLATDYFASKAEGNILGVLTNGSSQRAHTVDTSDGKHHVFSHFSSATFRGADTYISKYFVVNPIKFAEEYLELQHDFGITPKVYMHPDCKFVTPWDILSNLAELRKTGNFNSTGCGFWKTLERYNNDVYSVSFQDACKLITFSESSFKDVTQYYKKDLASMPSSINMSGLERHFIDDMFFLFHHVIWIDDVIINQYENIIFENGQGLMIGEQQPEKDWEYCTPSNTGIKYAVEIIRSINSLDFKQKKVEICYVSRTYMTRHGQGNIPNLCQKQDINPEMNDRTNVFNICQGHLRYGLLPVQEMLNNFYHEVVISTDLYFNGIGTDNITFSLMLTHWNEYHDNNAKLLFEKFEKVYISDNKIAESVKLKEEVIK